MLTRSYRARKPAKRRFSAGNRSRLIITPILLAGIIILTAFLAPPAIAQDAVPSSLSESYGSWVVRCETPTTEGTDTPPARSCRMRQEQVSQETRERVLLIVLSRTAERGGIRLTAVTPFGLDLAQGFALADAERTLITAPFETCLPAGCIVTADVSTELINQLAARDSVFAVMVPNGNDADAPLRLTVLLDGFVDAWNRLVALSTS